MSIGFGISVYPALSAPGTDSVEARLAAWARDHELGWVVTGAEQVLYQATKPPEGGPAADIPDVEEVTVDAPVPTATPSETASAQPSQPPQLALTRLSVPGVSLSQGEGEWKPLLGPHTDPWAHVAFVRPDAAHPRFMVSAIHMDQKRLKFNLFPGSQVPGGSYAKAGVPNQLTGDVRASVLATFNSGFMMKDTAGGYWQNGVAVEPLKAGAASMVFTKDGAVCLEEWQGKEPASDVAAVRQNLVFMVKDGKPVPEVKNPKTSAWGKTVGNEAFVWRSAIGQRTDGSLVYVIGPALSVVSLADIMVAAGCDKAMELDINSAWTSFIL